MAQRITKKDLDSYLPIFCKQLRHHGVDTTGMHIEYSTYVGYRIVQFSKSGTGENIRYHTGTHNPFGHTAFRAADLYHAMHFASDVMWRIELAKESAEKE